MSLLICSGDDSSTQAFEVTMSDFQTDSGKIRILGAGGNDLFEMTYAQFAIFAHYVLTATNLQPDDPRLKLVRAIQAMTVEDRGNSDSPGQLIGPHPLWERKE